MKAENRYKDYRNRKSRKIHVSYHFETRTGHGVGSVELKLNGGVTVGEIKEYIENKYNFSNVVVLSWQPITRRG